jgi:hypothetical protein
MDNSCSIVTGSELDGGGLVPSKGKLFLFSGSWVNPSFLSGEYLG